MTSSGKVGEIFASAGEAFARENRFFSLTLLPFNICTHYVVDPDPVDGLLDPDRNPYFLSKIRQNF
jgi:hypothetical protein